MEARHFGLDWLVGEWLDRPGVGATARPATLSVLRRAIARARREESRTLRGWCGIFREEYERAGAPAGPLGPDWPGDVHCEPDCPGRADSPFAHDESEFCETLLGRTFCEVGRRWAALAAAHVEGLDFRGFVVRLAVESRDTPPPGGSPFRARTRREGPRSRIVLSFGPRSANGTRRNGVPIGAEERARLLHCLWHECAHALEGACAGCCADGARDFRFSEGWMDEVAAALCREAMGNGAPHRRAALHAALDTMRARGAGKDAALVAQETGQQDALARAAERRERGKAACRDFRLLSERWFRSDTVFWRVTMGLHAASSPAGDRLRADRWKGDLVEILGAVARRGKDQDPVLQSLAPPRASVRPPTARPRRAGEPSRWSARLAALAVRRQECEDLRDEFRRWLAESREAAARPPVAPETPQLH